MLFPFCEYEINEQFVDDVLIDAPLRISKELIVTLKIDVVVRGVFKPQQQQRQEQQLLVQPQHASVYSDSAYRGGGDDDELYEEARQLGILQEIHGGMRLSGESLC